MFLFKKKKIRVICVICGLKKFVIGFWKLGILWRGAIRYHCRHQPSRQIQIPFAGQHQNCRIAPEPLEVRASPENYIALDSVFAAGQFFATQINFLIFTLIANGHDLYSTLGRKYAKSLGDIEEVNRTVIVDISIAGDRLVD